MIHMFKKSEIKRLVGRTGADLVCQFIKAFPFVLLIVGLLLFCTGIGMIYDRPEPWASIGIGCGLAISGLIIALRKCRA